ncbi:hypothetical protein LINPERPRIM_LOCUS32465, partial [Linum perenne]
RDKFLFRVSPTSSETRNRQSSKTAPACSLPHHLGVGGNLLAAPSLHHHQDSAPSLPHHQAVGGICRRHPTSLTIKLRRAPSSPSVGGAGGNRRFSHPPVAD